MKNSFDRALRRFGAPVRVEHGSMQLESWAFLQQLSTESGGEPFSVGPLGAADARRWRYLGTADAPVEMGDRVHWGARCFVARQAAKVYLGGRLLYCRAILQEEEV